MKKIYLVTLSILLNFTGFSQYFDTTSEEARKQYENQSILKKGTIIQTVSNSNLNSSASVGVVDSIFNYTGGVQYYIVPIGVTSISIEAWGAQGGFGTYSGMTAAPGLGGYAKGNLSVTPGQILEVYVGGEGTNIGPGGFNGGGMSGSMYGAAGGGASDVRRSPYTLNDRVIVGGGGGGASWGSTPCKGGHGGDFTGGSGESGGGFTGATGGTQFSGGVAGCCYGATANGSFGLGGGTGDYHNAGGGGGWYGGGTGAGHAGAGGGSSYIALLSDSLTLAGINAGNGIVKISILSASICPDDITLSASSSSCGVVVDYFVNTPPKGSLIQTAGLPTGSEFPAGTTTNCFHITDSLGVESTCCFSITVVDSVAPVAVCKSGGNGNVLLLWDVDNANTQSLKTAIEAEGYSVTMPTVPEYQWDNTNPPLDGFDAVIHLNGETYSYPLPLVAQNALVDFVNVQGKAFIHAEWDAYEIDDLHRQDAMSDITILQRYTGNTEDLTYTVVPGKESHQVLKDIPDSFTISYVGFSPTTLRSYATEPAEMLMTDQYGTAAVAVREFGNGKVVGFNHAGNYYGSDALTNNLVQQLYINALNWAAGGTFQLDKNGKVAIAPEDIDGGSTDNCGIASIDIDRTQFTSVDLGEQTVTLTVTDNAGNSSSCQSVITITKYESPDSKALCNPIDINLDVNGEYQLDSLDMVEITGLSPDSLMTFDDMKIFAYPDTFTTANIDWPVFVRITEYDQNYTKTRCWAMVTVHDLMPPTVVGKEIEITLDSAGMAVITKEQVTDPATFDVSGIVSTSIDKDTFTCANIGENWVILSATDIYGNAGTDSVLVTVNSGLPALDAIPDVNITVAAGICETTIEYPIPVINEICGISATQTAGLGRDGLFPVGTTTESWIIVNCKGDTTEVSFDVTVTAPNAFPALDVITDVNVDEDAPEISVPIGGITYGNDCQAQIVTVVAETDNAELVDSVAVVYTDGDTTGVVKLTLVPDMSGTAKITVTVTDSEGASMFRSFNLVVNEVADTIANKDGNLATAVWTKEIETGINMYPNPTKDMVTIDIKNYTASQTEVAVFSITGSEVIRKTYPVGETIRFSMSDQVSGVYLVKMNIDGNHIIKKLVVDKK